MFEYDPTLPQRLEQYMRGFRADFRRREQAEWAAVYLQGLLQPGGRKTIENLARTVVLPDELQVDDVAQALQHFINQSPWDEQKLYRRYHRRLVECLDPAGVFALEEFAFVKQGRHSVGVQRQYSTVLGRKTNCQVAIGLHHLSDAGLRPLALRLYLPRHWLEDRRRLDETGVPDTVRHPASKAALALQLLDEVRAAGIPADTVAPGSTWGSSDQVAAAVEERGWKWRPEISLESGEAVRRGRQELQNELGLDHFEGRSWRGFHHHSCLVVLAYGFLMCLREQAVGAD